MPEVFANVVTGTVTAGGTTAPAAGTSQTWTVNFTSAAPATGASSSTWFYLADTSASAGTEMILVTSCPGGTGSMSVTVTRGADGTTPVAHTTGFTVQQVITRASLYNLAGLAPTADTTGAADTANALAMYNLTGRIVLQRGAFYWTGGGISINASGAYLIGQGRWATTIYCVGAGDTYRNYDSSAYSARTVHGGGILGVTFDGTNCTGNSSGVHFGDIFQFTVDFGVQNFTAGTTSKGAWLDDCYYWAEQMSGRIYSSNCTAGIVFDVNGGVAATGAHVNATGSYERCNLDLNVNQGTSTFDGVVFQNGAFVVNGSVRIHGNFGSSSSVLTSAVLRLSGSTPSGITDATTSSISNSMLDIGVECDDSTGTNGPYTIYFGSGSVINNCWGGLNFGAASAFRSSNCNGQLNYFIGPVLGDTNTSLLAGIQFASNLNLSAGVSFGTYAAAAAPASGGTIASSAYSPVTNTAPLTGMLLSYPTGFDAQICIVANKGTDAISFAPAASSYITNGSETVIGPGEDAIFVFDYNASNWLRVGPPNDQFMCLASAYTLTSTTSAQKLFNASANGALTLQPGTYFFECEFDLSALSATSGTFSFALGGTATFTTKYNSQAVKEIAGQPTSPQAVSSTSAAATALATANTNTAGSAIIRGVIRVTTAGTVIPQVALGVAAAAVVGANSWFRAWPAGSSTSAYAGAWS